MSYRRDTESLLSRDRDLFRGERYDSETEPEQPISEEKRLDRMSDHLCFCSLEIAQELDAADRDADLLAIAKRVRNEMREKASG